MYPPKHFVTYLNQSDVLNSDENTAGNEEKSLTLAAEKARLYDIIESNPLATLLVNVPDEIAHVSHIPFHFDQEKQYLIGHVSNQHPLAQQLQPTMQTTMQATMQATKAVVHIGLVFHGPNAYISPNYSEGQPVPTWNYAKIHIKGCAVIINNPTDKYLQMQQTTAYFEQTQPNPWLLDALPSSAIENMLKAITIFKVSIDDLQGQLKLSQNKSSTVTAQIISRLTSNNQHELAAQMN